MKKILVFLAVLGSVTRLSATPCPSVQWTQQHDHAAGLATWSMLTLDYDGDGKLDLISQEGSGSGDGTLYSRRGVGDGTFEAPVTIHEHVGRPVLAVDVDGNGITDLVAPSSSNGLLVFHGTGSGFGLPTLYFLDYYPSYLAAGNFDADPAIELVALSAGGNFFVFYDNNAGTFNETQRVTTGDLPSAVGVADFDNDGRYDVVVGERIPETMSVFFRNANGSFASPVTLPSGDFPAQVATGDLNGDGLRDFVVSEWTDGDVRVYRNSGSRQFTQTLLTLASPASGAEGSPLVLQDLNADGALDIIAAAINGNGGLATFTGIGDGTFRTPSWSYPSPFTSGGVTSIAVGDLNANSVLDVVAATADQHISFSASCATQAFAAAKPRTISFGQDAIIEVAISGFDSTPPVDRGTVSSEGESVAVGTNGRALLHVPDLALGTHQLTVAFSGNEELTAASSEPVEVNVITQSTTTTLSTPPTQPVYGEPWSVIVSINGTFNSPLSDNYTLLIDGVGTTHYTGNGAVALNLEPGPHTIQAIYEGSYSQPRSESDVVSVTSLKATPTVTPTGALTVRLGSAHSLQFAVTGSATATTPTGTLQLFEGTTLIASASLVSGVVSFSPTLQRGAHDVQAIYSGDSKFDAKTINLMLYVLGATPLAIEARGMPTAVHIAYLTPDNTTSVDLYRRVAGTVSYEWVPSWDSVHGYDSSPLTRGVVYEYVLLAALSNGSTINSNVDSAMLFTDDTLASGTKVKLAHFVELKQAVNEMRGAAGLAPFNFAAGFGAGAIVRASYFNGLSTALGEARNALGMAPATLPTVIAGSTKISATTVQKLRDAAR
jgi:hypothetical protein